MADELQRLLIRIAADTEPLRRDLARAEKGVGTFSRNVTSSLGQIDRAHASVFARLQDNVLQFVDSYSGLSNTVRIAASVFRGMAVGVAAAVTFDAIQKGVKHAAAIKGAADAADLTTRRFQELSFAVTRAGGDQDAFSASMRRFATNVAEVRKEQGGFYDFLQERAPALLAQIRATENQSEAFDVLANAISTVETEEAKATLARAAFGAAGKDMLQSLKNGAAGFYDAAAAANELGVVLDEEAIAGAKKTKAEFDSLMTFMEARVRTGTVEVAKILRKAWEGWQKIFASVGIGGADDTAALEQRFTALTAGFAAFRKGAAGKPWELGEKGGSGGGADSDNMRAVESLIRQREMAERRMDSLRAAALDAEGRHIEAIQVEYERDLESYRDLANKKLITEKEFQEARASLQAVMGEKLRDEFMEIERAVRGPLEDAFNEVFTTGKLNVKSFFRDLVSGLGEAITKALILKPLMNGLFGGGSGSSIAGFLGDIFAPGRAGGGPAMAGAPYWVGEQGPELFVPHAAGNVVNARASAGAGTTVVNNYDFRGAEAGVEQRVYQTLSAVEAQRKDPATAVAERRARFPTRRV